MLTELRTKLTDAGLQYKVDDSGASVGKRYARNDELGIPYAITIDFDTLGIGDAGSAPELLGTTLRDRDSTDQVRLPLAAIAETLAKLCSAHPLTFADLKAAYATPEAAAANASPSEDMMAYLNSHGVAVKLNAVVNKLAKEKPKDPMAWLVAELKSERRGGRGGARGPACAATERGGVRAARERDARCERRGRCALRSRRRYCAPLCSRSRGDWLERDGSGQR